MRVRLPPSVISTIESHLRPDFHPVLSLSTILNPVLDPNTTSTSRRRTRRTTSETSSNGGTSSAHADSSASYSSNVAGPSQPRVIRPTSDAIPLSVPHLLRHTAPQKHINAAHAYLSSDKFDPSSPTSLLRRQVTYSRFISTFLSHPSGLPAIRTLLSRSLSEGVPISTPTLTNILKSVLDSTSHITDRVAIIQSILPLLPDRLDLPLLDLLMRNVIRDTEADPAVVEKMIEDCLKLDGCSTAGGGREGWPWQVWDLVLLAHAKRGEFREAINLLAEFKQVVEKHINSHSPSNGETELSDDQKAAVCRAYTTVLNIWHSQDPNTKASRIPGGRVGSLVPRQLAKDLIGLLGGERPGLGFLNSWMKAERMAENWEAARKVWELIEGRGDERDSAQAGYALQREASVSGPGEEDVETSTSLVASKMETVDEGPNAISWINLYSLYLHPSSSDNLPPLRSSLRQLLSQSSQTNPNRNSSFSILSPPVIRSILKAIFHHHGSSGASAGEMVDLPCALLILRLVNSARNIELDRRTIDYLASGLMNTTRSFSESEKKRLGVWVAKRTSRKANGGRGGRRGWTKLGLDLEEWDTISAALHRVRVRTRTQAEGGVGKEGKVVEMIHLPMSIPIGRVNITNTSQSVTEGDIELADQQQQQQVVIASSNSELDTTTTTELVAPLITLLERTIVSLYRHEYSSTNDDGVEDGEILRQIMTRINEEVLPPSRRDRRRAKANREFRTVGN
ncbi:hypothetical protein CI109_103258 [Kwoniella shandongensis]|uniref:Uncharacterized protein n=1 Tax=Kwoniella shandongensis TaxID=1734106 RepID=A0A5M6BX83_9TREE|nr:uncharacterized protein CI109_006070 [Kwoniella shandongensis]KAA5525619.1 hypothetical protein CI109_006070 [Kwoniella shandongensis]